MRFTVLFCTAFSPKTDNCRKGLFEQAKKRANCGILTYTTFISKVKQQQRLPSGSRCPQFRSAERCHSNKKFSVLNRLYLTDTGNQAFKIFRIYISDVANAEGVCLRNLSRIDHETAFFQLQIESLEIESGIGIIE